VGKYLVRRLLQSILVVMGVTFLSYFSLFLSGDPTYLYVAENATTQEIEATRKTLGFDRPIIEQYAGYLWRLVRGDMGQSLQTRTSALELVLERLPATLELAFFAMLISTLFAIPIGIVAAINRGKPIDGAVMLLAMFGQSMPSFWLGIMLILFVGLTLGLLPLSGQIPLFKPLIEGKWGELQVIESFRHLILPSLTIGVFSLSRNARLIRSSMLEALPQDYVITARAKGLRERAVVMRHAFRNALIPITTMLGLEFGFLLSGVVVAETVFSWPGVGRLVFHSINQKDIPVVQASVVFFSFMFVTINLLVDVLYAYLDPRVRLS